MNAMLLLILCNKKLILSKKLYSDGSKYQNIWPKTLKKMAKKHVK